MIAPMRQFALFFFAAVVFAQQPPAPEPGKPKRMPEPKNLRVLKVPPSELIGIMRNYSAALGKQCTFCHVQGNFASDENPHKEIARKMIVLTQDVNAKLTNGAEGKTVVSCFTCHRGEEHPQVDAPAGAGPGGQPRPGGSPPPAAQ